MLKSKVLSGVMAGALAVTLLAGLSPAQAMTGAPAPMPAVKAQPALDAGTRAQLAAEAGITPQQAAGMSLTQLSELKNKHDGDDGPYSGVWVVPPHPGTHS